jgi:hypothetical protein
MGSDHDPLAHRVRGHRTLHRATGALVTLSVLGAGLAVVATVPGTPAGTAQVAVPATSGTAATGGTAPAATTVAPVAATHGS